MLKKAQFVVGLILLIALEILRVYFIMPFPGSQRSESIDLAYFLHQNIFYFRTIGWLIILIPAFYFFSMGSRTTKVLTIVGLLFYGFIFYMFNFRFLADKMFYQPEVKEFASAGDLKGKERDLVIGITVNGESRAYPVEIIGYHHQVRDTVGNEPVMITYCTVCRTGRVFRPEVDGKPETFRLVGMDHFNAMFEDKTTQSWWRQVNGEAVAGPLQGKELPEIPSYQMTLEAWLAEHPDSKVMKPDPKFQEEYDHLKEFDEGSMESSLEGRDSLSWKEKSWIVGVVVDGHSKAYDWNELLDAGVINDTVFDMPVVVAMRPDSVNFHVWLRDSLTFRFDQNRTLQDEQTLSTWNWQGRCVAGELEGKVLKPVQSYQEFWHSWKTFRPESTQYVGR